MNWDQLKTILWLRWRLTRNQWTRSKGIGAVFSAIVAVGVFVLGVASFVGALLGGIFGLRQEPASVVWVVWLFLTLAFLFIWTGGLLQEIQRSETIDLQRLMHLPVALGQIFVINYLTSHLAVSVVIGVPAMMGLTIGLAISRGPALLLLAPLALSMVFMVTAWTYCLRGWLASLMSNPRRRRNVTVFIVMAFVLLGQGPNLYFNVFRRYDKPAIITTTEQGQKQREARKASNQESFGRIRSIQKFIPPLWLPIGAQALVEGNVLPALGGTLGCLAIGALGLWRAYRATLRSYLGDSGGKAPERIKPARTPSASAPLGKTGSRFMELRLPAVPEQATALALATFRSLLRAPEVKMAWGTSIIVPLLACGSLLFRTTLKVPDAAKPFIATGAMVFSVFLLVQFFANQFGFDRDGFRALILSPAERRNVLLGKNLACLPVGVGFGLALLALIAIRLQFPLLLVLAALLQLGALLLLAGIIGNLLSIVVPYRIQQGSTKPTKMPALAMLALVGCSLLFPVAMSPVFLAPLAEFLWRLAGWPDFVPVNLIFSAVLFGVTMLAYWQTLGPLGGLLQRRETKILGVVTVEVE